jgi:RND family efflux transporter MFP subunit
VEVADPSVLDAVLTLSPADVSRVRSGQGVALHAGAEASGKPMANGRVASVGAAVDTASRGVTVRVEVVSGAGELRIGETVFGRIVVGEHANAVVVPLEALVPTGEGFKVFVVDDKGIAMSRPVKLGGRSDHGAWVTEGLKPGELIVTKGAYGVDDSTKIEGTGDAKGEGKDVNPGEKKP